MASALDPQVADGGSIAAVGLGERGAHLSSLEAVPVEPGSSWSSQPREYDVAGIASPALLGLGVVHPSPDGSFSQFIQSRPLSVMVRGLL